MTEESRLWPMRLISKEEAEQWRKKRLEHMMNKTRELMKTLAPGYDRLYKRMPDQINEFFQILNIYDIAATNYVDLEMDAWEDSQVKRAADRLLKFMEI